MRALTADPRELARLIFGRLGYFKTCTAASLATAARNDPEFYPAPRWPCLTPPDAERLRLVGHEGEVMSAAFSPDGTRIVTASLDNTIRIWDAATGSELRVLTGHKAGVMSAAFSPDGTRIVTASLDNTARIWDAATRSELRVLTGHEAGVMSAAFSADGTRIVTASHDSTARVWDAATGSELRVLTAYHMMSAAYSPDGTCIVTASCDAAARVWDAATGSELRLLTGHHDEVVSAAFSADGTRIVTASPDDARVWDAATGSEGATKRRKIDYHRVTTPHDALHGATDGETLLGERLGRITNIFLVCREHSDESVPLADDALAGADFTRVGQEDFRPGEIDALGHGARTSSSAATPLEPTCAARFDCCIVKVMFGPVNPYRARGGEGIGPPSTPPTPAPIAVQQHTGNSARPLSRNPPGSRREHGDGFHI